MIALEDRRDLGELGPLGIKAFIAICSHWHLEDMESANLLGVSIKTMIRWRTNPPPALGIKSLERISHTIAIFHALGDLLPNLEARNEWVHKLNSAEPFGGTTVLSVMSAASNNGLRVVRCYLEAQLGSLPPGRIDK